MARVVHIIYWFLLEWRTRYVFGWVLAILSAFVCLYLAWFCFDSPKRSDATPMRRGGNYGHTTVDFGGQWLMGRMLVLGNGRHLYHRNWQRGVFEEAYPEADEIPDEDKEPDNKGTHEAGKLMGWIMGKDDPRSAKGIAGLLAPFSATEQLQLVAILAAEQEHGGPCLKNAMTPSIGGPLYPPIQAVFMAPVGLFPPTSAYRVMQVTGIVFAVVIGWGLRLLSHGRLWLSLGITAAICFPGFSTTVSLGQSSFIAAAVLIWGWVLLDRDRPFLAGLVWGLLAYKPVWAMAFFLAPLLLARWRMCLGMLIGGTGLAAATLPLVGLQGWLDWFDVGREASVLYNTDENWIFLSRDLLSIPRRWLLKFETPAEQRDTLAATLSGWCLLLFVLESTVRVAIFRRPGTRRVMGPVAAFILFGSWLTCYHFMYYDVLLAMLPIAIMLNEPGRFVRPVLLAVIKPAPELPYHAASPPDTHPPPIVPPAIQANSLCVLNSLVLTLLAVIASTEYPLPEIKAEISLSFEAMTRTAVPLPLKFSTAYAGTPINTFCLLLLWLWMGWQARRSDQWQPTDGRS